MTIQPRKCANCHHFRPSVGYVPHECSMENLPTPIESDLCDEHQTDHEAAVDQAQAIMRGAVIKARESAK